ncbi:MAG TPA: helicase-related protein [Patescibacteria group bacterium]|nr:helicase-related protein [Patescibacteria group bacterium]
MDYFIGQQVRHKANRDIGVITSITKHGTIDYASVIFPSGLKNLAIHDLEVLNNISPDLKLTEKQFGHPDDYKLMNLSKYVENVFRNEPYHSLLTSRMTLQPHQVSVAHKVVNGLSPRYILADEVGLGKTIEAGLIIKELRARGLAERILVLVPANLTRQWEWEMRTKFNENYVIYDSTRIKELKSLYPNTNPWDLNNNIICSVHYARLEEVKQLITDTNWDLVIFDEAHHLRRQLDFSSSIRSNKAYDLAEELSFKTDGLLLLTATPMQLHDFEFFSLTELLDPTLYGGYENYERYKNSDLPIINSIHRAVENSDLENEKGFDELLEVFSLYSDRYNNLHVKAQEIINSNKSSPGIIKKILKEEISKYHIPSKIMIRNRKRIIGGFTRRTAKTIGLNLSGKEAALYEAVTRYVSEGYNVARRNNDYIAGFLMVIFQKLLTSSSYALKAAMTKRRNKLSATYEQNNQPTSIVLDVDDESFEDLQKAEEIDTELLHGEIERLNSLIKMADEIKTDTKLIELMKVCKEVLKDKTEKILIFTQFTTTLEYLKSNLSPLYEIAVFHGGMKTEEKDRAIEDFRNTKQILICTEAGGEGRNMQFCYRMVNYDLPWNPIKIEQRIGRVDRFGQKKDVIVYNFATRNTIEERILAVLTERIKIFEETIGGLDPILGDFEDEIKDIIMADPHLRGAGIDKFANDIEYKMHIAREMEINMADFVMDFASLNIEKANELINNINDRPNELLQKFITTFFSCYFNETGELKETKTPGIYNIQLPDKLIEHCKKYYYRSDGFYSTIKCTFNKAVAEKNEGIEYVTYGHWLVKAIFSFCNQPDLRDGTSAFMCIEKSRAEEIGIDSDRGFMFSFSVCYRGVEEKRELIPIFIDLENNETFIDKEFSIIASDYEEESHEDPDTEFYIKAALAKQQVEPVLIELTEAERNSMQESNQGKVEVENRRITKQYEYRIKAINRKINRISDQINDLRRFGDSNSQRIIPALQGQIKALSVTISEYEKERDQKLAELSRRQKVVVDWELISAAAIEFIS